MFLKSLLLSKEKDVIRPVLVMAVAIMLAMLFLVSIVQITFLVLDVHNINVPEWLNAVFLKVSEMIRQ